jgi:hypothetical protein
VAATRGTSDVVEFGWQLGFGFEAKLMWEDVWGGGGAPKVLWGRWSSPEGLRFELEIKFEFS